MRRMERQPVGVGAGVKAGELNLGEAKEVLGLGHRQTKRVWKRQDAAGTAGRAHRLRGQPGRRPVAERQAEPKAAWRENKPAVPHPWRRQKIGRGRGGGKPRATKGIFLKSFTAVV
jgi:hypothetical protein